MLAGVELAGVHALLPEITCETRNEQPGVTRDPQRSRRRRGDWAGGRGAGTLTRVADAGVRAPVVAAVAVLGADVGVARVGQVAAVLHADLQALSHVHVGHVVGRLAHADTLTMGAEEKVLSCPSEQDRRVLNAHKYTPVCNRRILC